MDAPHTKMAECSPPLHIYCIVQHTRTFYPPPLQWRNSPLWARASSWPWLHDHTQMHHTFVVFLSTSDRPEAKTPIWQHSTQKRQTSMPPAGFELPIPASERRQTHALHRAAIRIGQNFKYCTYSRGAVGWGTALQTGRPRVRFSMVSLEFFVDIILPAALWPWGLLGL
jgi:hypothetical protein